MTTTLLCVGLRVYRNPYAVIRNTNDFINNVKTICKYLKRITSMYWMKRLL